MSEPSGRPPQQPDPAAESVADAASEYLASQQIEDGLYDLSPEERQAAEAIQAEVIQALATNGEDLALDEGQSLLSAFEQSLNRSTELRGKVEKLIVDAEELDDPKSEGNLNSVIARAALGMENQRRRLLWEAVSLSEEIAAFRMTGNVEMLEIWVASISMNDDLTAGQVDSLLSSLESLVGESVYSEVIKSIGTGTKLEEAQHFQGKFDEIHDEVDIQMPIVDEALRQKFGLSPNHDNFSILKERLSFAIMLTHDDTEPTILQKEIDRVRGLAAGMGLDEADLDNMLDYFSIHQPSLEELGGEY